ncbi:coiled-coil domain-containing protein 170 isoform X2 [Hemicordylus capensis]|uniref:coiled-coil domain-containing protein 170 isoform X2 n=1 Tax=Hemicordylus capensis TaxID=884348 RepID=UPI0023049A3D|nr:coiled-coil domain-containing protein 170 isoform X2 [Hemicordylus capensis]
MSSGGTPSPRAGFACSRLIDVTSNTALLSPRVTMAASRAEEVQDQLDTLKNEEEQRDKLTSERNKGRLEAQKQGAHNYFLLDIPVAQEQLCHYRNAAETASSELAALLVKYECAQAELLDLKSKLASKEVSIQELKAEVESHKENNARQSSLLFSIQSRLQEIEKESGTIAISKKQADLKAQTVLQENLELKEKIHEQERQIRKYLSESEESQIQASKANREHGEFIARLCHFCDVVIKGKEESQELLFSKISDMHKENTALKAQIATFEATIHIHDIESKANRETILRLASELNKEQSKTAACSQDMEDLSDDLNSTTAAKQSLEKEIRILQDRLTASQRAWEVSQQELSHLRRCSSEKEDSLKSSIEEARAQEVLHNEFKEQIITLLKNNSIIVNPSKEAIVEKIQEMCHGEENKRTYIKFLDQLSEKMNLGSMAVDIGFDMRLDAVLARLEQLIKLEGDALTENKLIARNLQRKLKTQKEKLDSKELHMNLLRQKIIQLEEEKQVRTALAVERDEANLTTRKLQKQVERLQNELSLARETNTDLKVKLADTNELKIRTLEQNKTIEDLSKSQEKLEKMKAKAEKQLTTVKSELHVAEREAKEDKEKARNMLESVASELKTLRTTLEEVKKRERQLADFREVISRMLHLNIATVALPDYEIITRLEALIHSHRHHFVPCICLKDTAMRQDGPLQLLH